ncbi:MAG: NUDIX hydrolase, partial [Methanobacteriota archaeon]
GYVEPRESIIQTIERELKEETNIVGRAGPLLAVRNRVTDAANDTFLIFRMAYVSGTPEPDRNEVSEASFVPLSDLATSKESAAFTQAIVAKLGRVKGLELDAYRPPADSGELLAYLLYL